METKDGRRDQKEDPDAVGPGPTPDHDDCDAKAGWLAAGDDGRYVNEGLTLLMAITGLSMAARAQAVVDPAEAGKILRGHTLFRVTPTVISVLDYSKGFGHTDLVTC